MIRWERYIHTLRDYVALFLLLSISTFFILENNNPQVVWMRSNVLSFMGVMQNWASSIYEYRALKAENEILRHRLALLSFENNLMKEAYLENDRLHKLLGFKRRSKFNLIPVRIIARSHQGFSSAFVIDVGIGGGVEKNMPVLTSEGLIGRVAIASGNTSVVQAIDDINFRVSAMIQRSRVNGIILPKTNGLFQLEYVPLLADVKLGDVVITSGVSEIYPKGIEIGIVSRIEAPPNALFKTIDVIPSVDLTNLEEAFVVRKNHSERR